MLEIILDASQIEQFESCNYKWYLDQTRNLTSKQTNPALSTGTFYHEVLKRYYSSAVASPPCSAGIRKAVDYAVELATGPLASQWPKVAKDPKFHLDRLKAYLINHMWEDDASKIIAVEKGFSYILFEDTERRFILEGMIDLVTIEPGTGLTVTDHKTQSRFYDKYAYNHQALNYLNFTGANYFRYNYIGLQDAINANTFRRPIFKPHPDMLEQWKKDVLKTFQRMEWCLREAGFARSRTSCDGKFGVCQFHKICETPDDSKWIPTILTAYKEKENKWRAWS